MDRSLPKDPKAPHISQLLAESPTEQILKKIAGFDLATASRDLNFQKKWLSKPKSYHILEEWTSLNSPKFIPSKLPESVRHFRVSGSAQRIPGARSWRVFGSFGSRLDENLAFLPEKNDVIMEDWWGIGKELTNCDFETLGFDFIKGDFKRDNDVLNHRILGNMFKAYPRADVPDKQVTKSNIWISRAELKQGRFGRVRGFRWF